jgi:hypothetical protein
MNAQLSVATVPYFAPAAIANDDFRRIRRSLMLNHCKWDSQVGDITALAPFPLILNAEVWKQLSAWAEALSAEVALTEQFLLNETSWIERLGMPRALRLLFTARDFAPTPSAARVIRYDFHWTRDGWKISEINSDVPGGYCEATSFTQLLAPHFPEARLTGDPTASWTDALAATGGPGSLIVFLSAPGLIEDQQIMSYLANRMRNRNCRAFLADPEQSRWNDGRASLHVGNQTHRADLIVRFYQAEWLPHLSPRCGWQNLFSGGATPVSNSGISVLLESKRFPLLLEELPLQLPACRALFPRTFEPRAVNWKSDERLIIKSALSNNADSVGNAALLPREHWENLARAIAAAPEEWVAQERFEPVPLDTPLGPVFPCIGVYTVNGKAAGIYGRVARKKIVDYEAIDIAVLSGEPR